MIGIGGLLAWAADIKRKMQYVQCIRCHLYFDHSNIEKFPHCGTLNQIELEEFKTKKKEESLSTRNLGLKFAMLSAVIFSLLLAISL